MPVSTRIYVGGSLGFGGQPTIDDLKAAAYSTVLVWSVHIEENGDLKLNDTIIVRGGRYNEATPMGLPATVAQLRRAGIEVLFSVGSGGSQDFARIGERLNGGVPGPGNVLYDNFSALKRAMVAAGGDPEGVDGIDFDNEDKLDDPSIMVNFGLMLRNIGYAHVTFCPWNNQATWGRTLNQLNQPPREGFVNAVHLQCYSGGTINAPAAEVQKWQDMIAAANSAGRTLLIPGLATNQPSDGPWWYKGAPGKSVVTKPGVAMNAQADWSKHVFTEPKCKDFTDALQVAQNRGGATFFFYCNSPVQLDPHDPDKQFEAGDAVYFAGVPSWSPTQQCDGYSLSGCRNIWNPNRLGACPASIQQQYRTWSGINTPPQGGFIWLYDSVVWCLLSGCCDGSEQNPATTAQAYRDAIVQGLSPGS
jgi:hypothetical protein